MLVAVVVQKKRLRICRIGKHRVLSWQFAYLDRQTQGTEPAVWLSSKMCEIGAYCVTDFGEVTESVIGKSVAMVVG